QRNEPGGDRHTRGTRDMKIKHGRSRKAGFALGEEGEKLERRIPRRRQVQIASRIGHAAVEIEREAGAGELPAYGCLGACRATVRRDRKSGQSRPARRGNGKARCRTLPVDYWHLGGSSDGGRSVDQAGKTELRCDGVDQGC